VKWGLQHVKVTLEEQESGETVVIEQSSDGRVKCERGKSGKAERAANSPPRTKEAKAEEPVTKPEEPRTERRRGETRKSDDRPARRRAQKPREGRKNAAPRRSTSLEWVPVRDNDYDGFAAESGVGHFKALIAKESIWALFSEIKDIGAKQIRCFKKLDDAKKEAQKRHDEGWPEAEFGALTAGRIAKFCPVPQAREEGERKDTMKTTPKNEEKAAEKPPPTPAASKTEAEKDRELLASFTSELERGLDEDGDD